MKLVFSKIGTQGLEALATYEDFPQETDRLMLVERQKFKVLSALKGEEPIRTIPVPNVKYDVLEIFI